MKKNYRKNLNHGSVTIPVISFVATIIVLFIVFMSFFSIGNQGAKQESNIEGTYRNNEQVLSSCAISIRNISKIPDKYRKDFESLVKTELEARYGGQTTDRVAIFVQERSLSYTPEMYTKIQNEILSCETKFSLAQAKLITLQTDYEYMLNSAYTGAFLKLNGYPKKDLTKFKIILDSEAKEQFNTGVRKDYDIK